ncbi:MAG TPA: hypothetical protein VL021_10485 [Brumimicrobium sp.]|nr:hypothetical protein [Brumimicrobium sp.]
MSDNTWSIIFTVLLFLVPVLFFAFKRKAFSPFSFKNLMKSFNRALIVQLVMGIIFVAIMFYLDSQSNTQSGSNFTKDVVMKGATNFIIIGVFYYLPAVVFLNVFAFILSRRN